MTPPKPPRKSMIKSTITSLYDIPQPVYEDPDASTPAVTVGSLSEDKVKPVPRPRIKSQPKAPSNTNSTVDSGDKTSNTTSAVSSQHSEYPSDRTRPRPVRPPPRPPSVRCLTPSKTTAAADRENQRISSTAEPTVKPPALTTEATHSPLPPSLPPPPPPCPERPRLPSSYYDSPLSVMRVKSKSYIEVSQQSTTPISQAFSEETVFLFGTYGEKTRDRTDRPAVPPRLWLSSLPDSASVCETSPAQTRRPPPPFNPPPPPSTGTQFESVYSEIEYRPYLDILPEDEDNMHNQTQGRSLPRPGLRFQSDCFPARQQSTDDTEDIDGMLRWLKRLLKSDDMTLSVYGLSIEEEIRSFNQRAMNVSKALRLYNLLMIKRNESLRHVIAEFSSISDTLDKMQKKAKKMGIAGGTTGAVGGVTAVVGIALAPVTMGVSLVATAVGAGMVASAGGMGAHAVKVKKNAVNRMRVEKLIYDCKGNIVDLEQCLDFILSGMNELRRHDAARLQRAGAQPDALKMAHLSQSVFRGGTNSEKRTSTLCGMSAERLLLAFANELDQYFTENDGQRLKKSIKSKFSGRVRLLAANLQDELDHLNHMWEMFIK